MKITTALLIATLIIGGSLLILVLQNNTTIQQDIPIQNVSMINGTQVIVLKAKGGYAPRITKAKADVPTILRFDTNGTFDCSASVRIPSLGVNEVLPPTGAKEITIEHPKKGTLQGSCGMGMYPFVIEFE